MEKSLIQTIHCTVVRTIKIVAPPFYIHVHIHVCIYTCTYVHVHVYSNDLLTVLDTVKGREALLPQYTPPKIKLSCMANKHCMCVCVCMCELNLNLVSRLSLLHERAQYDHGLRYFHRVKGHIPHVHGGGRPWEQG